MEGKENDFKLKLGSLSKMDNVFSIIANKYKKETDKYLSKKSLDNLMIENGNENLKIKEEIEKGIFFNFKYPYFFIKKDNEKAINIEFLVKSKFKDDENKEFSFWVCSFNYLKEKLEFLGYKTAKVNKKILFSEEENENEKNKVSNNSLSESLDDQSDLDNELFNYKVKISKSNFSLNEIFDKAQEIFDPFNNIENIEYYKKDLNIPKSFKFEKPFKFVSNYATNLKNIFKKKNNIYSFFYNENSGLTLSLLQTLESNREIFNSRYFCFNSEYLNNYKKNYFYFRIAKLFKNEEKQLFNEVINLKSEEENIIYNTEYIINILNKVLEKFNNTYIIFDNIKNNVTFQNVQNLIKELKYSKNCTIFLFISINSLTLNLIRNVKSISSEIISLSPIECLLENELPPKEYFNSFFQQNESNYKENYKKNIKMILNNFNDKSIGYLIFLINLLHNNSFKKNNMLIEQYNYMNNFLPYLYVSLNTDNIVPSINKLYFRTKFIKEIIIEQLNLLLSKYLTTDKIFTYIKTKSTEGIYSEKEILYYLINKFITLNKIKIDQIYCFNSKLEAKILNPELIFIQENESAPLYDFGIIKYFNNELVFKGYQIGINKPYKSLLSLNKEKIKMDMLYFIKKINKFLKLKITKFTFGIITTIYAYKKQKNNNGSNNNDNEDIEEDFDNEKKEEENDNEYKNYNIMKNYCKENNYEFLLFDPKNINFFVDVKKRLKKINFNSYYDKTYENKIDNYLFNNEDNYSLTKLPLNGNEIKKTDKEFIESKVNDLKDKRLNFIGKFKIEKSVDNINEIKIDDLINDNFLIYTKDKGNNASSIFFKKNYLCNENKKFEVFYVFDTSLNKKKRKKKDTISPEDIIQAKINSKKPEDIEQNSKLLNQKREREKESKKKEKKGKKEKNNDLDELI